MKNMFCYIAGFLAIIAPVAHAKQVGAVYAQTNAPSGNSVIMLPRSADGTLGSPAFFPTGGTGTGAGLGSQGSVTMTVDGRWLIVANAGSNDVSTFSIAANGGLTLMTRVPSNGILPTSVTVYGDTVVVLNAGDRPNISAFQLTSDGDLVPIRGASAELQGTRPAEVLFDDHGELLVVTDRGSNQIEVFQFDDDRIETLYSAPSAGSTPFGFAFAHNDVLVVSEAAVSSASSYKLSDERLRPISQAVRNTQAAACWVAISNDGKIAYTANAQSHSISSYSVAPDGSLALIRAVAGETLDGTAPIDIALTRNGAYLYSVATGTISAFRTSRKGDLTNVGVASGLPTTLAGLAVR